VSAREHETGHGLDVRGAGPTDQKPEKKVRIKFKYLAVESLQFSTKKEK
jgi:hypothetical protein